MLSKTAVTLMSALTYRPDAERRVCWIPLSGIFWEDELLLNREFANLSEEDQHQILRLFGIRINSLAGTELGTFPQNRAFSRRSSCQDETSRCSGKIAEWLLEGADEYEISVKDGIETFSATFDLTKGRPVVPKKRSRGERIFRRAPFLKTRIEKS